jgi:tRNA dimethylallyltransferase
MTRLQSEWPIWVVVGPTASGKTALALDLARRYGAEVVACDALQVRDGLPLLTAKPTPEETAQVPHHLYGVFPIDQPATAAGYAERADAVIADLHARGKRVVLCGGTGLYLRALCDGLVKTPPADPALRLTLRQDAQRLGIPALHERLRLADPDTAARIGPTDWVRIERGLEVFLQTGKPLSAWHAEHQAERARGPRYHTIRIGLDPGPDELRARIAARIRTWLDTGLLEEVRDCLDRHGPLKFPPIGYDAIVRHLRGQLDRDALFQELLHKTAQYARRQRTFFRADPTITFHK